MSDTSPTAGCLPTADAVFGPVQDCRHFDFTITFEQYFFSILPAVIFIIIAPFRLKSLSKSPSFVAGSVFQYCKIGAVILFAALQLALVALWAIQSDSLGQTRTASLAASCVSFVASLLLCVLSYTEHARSLRPSSLLNAYLLVSLLLDAAIVRSFWLAGLSDPIRDLFTVSFAVKAALLVLEAVEKASYVKTKDSDQRNPEVTSGLYNRGLFWWMNPLLVDGFRRLLQPSDLYALDQSLAASVLNDQFWKTWNSSRHTNTYKLLLCCVKTLKWPLLGIVGPRLCLLAFTICQPLLLSRFLAFLQNPTEDVSIGYGLVGAYALVYVGIAISSALYQHRNARTITMLRGVLVSAIFSRTTDLSTVELNNSAAVTLMSTDVDAIIRAWRELHEIWANIIQIGLATWLLSVQIGFACVGPVIICGLALGASILSGPRTGKYMMAWISKVQERIGTTSTMLGHMKSIKMSGLGHKLGLTIAQLRKDEIDAASPFRVMSAVNSATAQVPLLLSPVAAFAFFTIRSFQTEETLDATRMFSSLSLIILLGQPLFWMLESVLDTSAALTCFSRIDKYLSTAPMPRRNTMVVHGPSTSPETEANDSTAQLTPDHAQFELRDMNRTVNSLDNIDVDTCNVSISWADKRPPVLRDLNISVKRGELAIVIGPVASGKTTLLKGLLGEVPAVHGDVKIGRQKIAWCEQTPWLINDTLRKNIIGFSEYDEDFYGVVTHMCDLDKDFSRLENQDLTLVGSKGIVLSGGQKQRVALARAIYSRPQLAFFDDPFSGLDNQTAQTVFSRLFTRDTGIFRRYGTTVVLATQAANFLQHADQIICLKDGLVAEQGTFKSLVQASGYTASLQKQQYSKEDLDYLEEAHPNVRQSSAQKASPKTPSGPEDKRRQMGDFSVYSYFFSTLGLYFNIGLLVCEVLWAFLSTFPTVWLNWWVESNAAHPNQRVGYYLGVYAALQTMAVISFGGLILFGMLFIAARSGIVLHRRLLDTVMWAPLSLFTNTDIGSITTIFSQDIGLIDRSLPLALLVSIANFLVVIGQAGLLSSSTGYVAITFPFCFILSFYLQRGYLRTSRQLRLLDLEEKAPVYSQFLETLSGLTTIRAFGWTESALDLNHKLVDRSQRPFYLLMMVQQWLVLVLNLFTAALAILVAGVAVSLRDSVAVGLTGVSLLQLITLAETLKLLIQFWTSLETSLGAVARIKNFGEDTPDERLPGEDHQPSADWLKSGAIELSHVSASYGEDLESKALDDVSLKIESGQKIGIVGRTGSGKSTLLLTLLRLLPNTSGSIIVDGVDTSTVPRDLVRAKLVAVSQDLFFLPGSVRQNVDPYDGATSENIEETLRRTGLWDVIAEKGGLDVKFEEDMLSHGQRQLFSLARAILRKATGAVVLFDEATSSVDSHTDALMKQVIREEFIEHTVLSVAHRLHTIVDFDRVIVLDHGCIVEDGNPQELMRASNSRFKELWNASRQTGRVK